MFILYIYYMFICIIYNIMYTTSNQESSISGGQKGAAPLFQSTIRGLIPSTDALVELPLM